MEMKVELKMTVCVLFSAFENACPILSTQNSLLTKRHSYEIECNSSFLFFLFLIYNLNSPLEIDEASLALLHSFRWVQFGEVAMNLPTYIELK